MGLCLIVCTLTILAVPSNAQTLAEPNPPVLPYEKGRDAPVDEKVEAPSAAPATEWTNHKSADGVDPSWAEQRMMWLMNRARQNPTAEGVWLAESNDPDVKGGRDFFGVDLDQLKSAFAALVAAPPAAFDIRLHDASEAHSLDLIARDAQDHNGQFDKIGASGFDCNGGRVSVFSYSQSALNAHAALNIDWGNGPDGMQDPPGHRFAIMDVFPTSLSNVGLAMVAESDPATQVGPLVFSGGYCHAGAGDNNQFIVGTVWDDLDMDGEYDEGEGLGGVTVMPDSGTFFAVTGDAGGYAIPISAGSYTITFSGGGLGQLSVSKSVAVGTDSVLLDLQPGEAALKSILLRRTTDSRWFMYRLSFDNTVVNIGEKGFVELTRSADYETVSRGDFDGDGEADLMVRDMTGGQNGRWILWTLSGMTITSQGFVDSLTRSADWQLVSTDDHDGDGKADVLVRNMVDGRWLLYLLDAHTLKSKGILALSTDLTDTVVGTGDFDGDGRSDVLLRRADGSWLMYTLDGLTAPVVGTPLMTTNLAFAVQALADFNGDGNIDVLLRRTDGRWFMYVLDGSAIITSGPPAMSENPAWSFQSAADFNADGKADALIRRADGVWFMYVLDGPTILNQGSLAMTKNPEFLIVTIEDYNGDGKADALLRRSDGRWILYGLDGDGPTILGKAPPDMTRNTAWVPQVE